MRKIFLFLFAAVLSIGTASAVTITLVDDKGLVDEGAIMLSLNVEPADVVVGDEVTASAQSLDEGWGFAYWKENGEIVSYSADYTFVVTGDHTLEAYFGMGMPVEMTDLAVDAEAMTITGSYAMEGVATSLVLGAYNGDTEMFAVDASASSISYNYMPLTVLYGEVWLDRDLFSMAAARVVADFGGELVVFTLNMTAAGETIDVTVTETTLSMEFGALLMKGVWYDAADEIEYPFEANIGGWDYSKAEDELLVTVTVGGQGDEDPWLGFGEGTMTLTNEEGFLTLTGEIKTNSGPTLNVTAYGQAMIMEMDVEAQLSELDMDGVNYLNLNGTDKLNGISVDLYLDNYTGQDKTYSLNEASTIMDGSISVYGDITKDGDTFSGVAYAETGGTLYVLPMTLAEFAPEYDNIVITGLSGAAEARYMGWDDEYYLALSLEGTWSDGTDNYPVLLEITDGYDPTVTSGTAAVSLTIGGREDTDPWLGNAEGEMSYTLSGQNITLRGKLENAWMGIYWDVTLTGTILPNYTRAVTSDDFGTICLPYGGKIKGATLWEFVQAVQDENGNITKVLLGSVDKLQAGVPYIFQATASEIAVYCDATVADEAGVSNGLHGTFDDNTKVAAGQYILSGGALCEVLVDNAVTVDANRAYVVLSEVPTATVEQVPGRRYIGMGVQGENGATGLDQIVAPEGQTVKAIVNGQLVIIRGSEKFNAQGQKL